MISGSHALFNTFLLKIEERDPLKEIAELIDSEDFDLQIQDKEKMTPLAKAASLDRLDVVKALIKRGAPIDEMAITIKNLDITRYLFRCCEEDEALYKKLATALLNKLEEEDREPIKKAHQDDPKKLVKQTFNFIIDNALMNVHQNKIIRKMMELLSGLAAKDSQSYPNVEEFIKSFAKGFCHGEVLLWLYKSGHGI